MNRINLSNLGKFRVGLRDRNVALELCSDLFLDYIKSLFSDTPDEISSEKKRYTLVWNLDLQKTRGDPLEPVF